jgi:LCP family protein required for cell wall assembly
LPRGLSLFYSYLTPYRLKEYHIKKNSMKKTRCGGVVGLRRKFDWLMVVFILVPILFLVVNAELAPIDSELGGYQGDQLIVDWSPRSIDWEQSGKPFTVLFVGTDSGEFPRGGFRPGRGRSDSIVLAQLDGEKINLLSIPRDTLVKVRGHGEDKINHAYAYEGIELTIETVEQFTGIPIDRYVILDYKGFEGIVDCLGGVEVEVDKSFESMHVQFEPGLRRLNGYEAYAFIRFRKEALGDIGRVKRQQRFIKAVLGEIWRKPSLTKLLGVFFQFERNGKTNLSIPEMICLAGRYKDQLKGLELNLYLVPGSFYDYKGISYWKPDQEKLREIINSHFSTLGVEAE